MAQPSKGTNFDEPPDVAVYFTAKVSLDLVVLVYDLSYAVYLGLRELRNPGPRNADYLRLVQYLGGEGGPQTVDVAQGCIGPLVVRYIDACYSYHGILPESALPLGMSRIGADYANRTLAFDDPAAIAPGFYGSSYFHRNTYLNL
jgi:hypothetical protein